MTTRIVMVYEFVESKNCWMYLFKDTGRFKHYSYIYKCYIKPTKKQRRKIMSWCNLEVKGWELWEDL